MGNDATSLSLSWVIAAVLQSSEVARPKRFELLTPRFVVWCSIQLSYGRVLRIARENVPKTSKAAGNAPLAIGFGQQWQGSAREVRLGLDIHLPLSPAGLTRGSIVLAKKMDCRVKPGNDECVLPPRHPPHALARSPRRVSRSTARSGIERRKVAPMVPSTRRISPPWARTSSATMASPSPTLPVRVEPWKASNRCA